MKTNRIYLSPSILITSLRRHDLITTSDEQELSPFAADYMDNPIFKLDE